MVVNSAPVMIALRPSGDMDVQIVRVFERTMDMVVFRVEAVQTGRYLVLLELLEFAGTLLGRSNMVVADRIVRTHAKHLENVLWIDRRLLRERLMRENPLEVLLEVMTFKMTGNILIAMACM